MYLWTGKGEAPIELTLYLLRKEIYHCLPSELDEEPWENIAADIAVMNAVARTSK